MSTLEINGQDADKARFIPLASDDGVWLHRTRHAQDLVDLVTNPFKWVAERTQVRPAPGAALRPAKLLDSFVISVDVATTVEPNTKDTATYIIDGIDYTGFISVKMMTSGGRFQFKSKFDYAAIEKKILDAGCEFVIAEAGERAFVHLHLGYDPDLRAALLCAAIENQDWLCALYNKLDLHLLDENGNKCGLKRLKFRLPAANTGKPFLYNSPRLDVIVQGDKATMEDVDACNAGSGTLIEDEYYMDQFVIKAYEPIPPQGG
jgi:hypothetical protein